MSVGQGKFLRAHQQKHNRVFDKTMAKVRSIKERQDEKQERAKKNAKKLLPHNRQAEP